MAQNSHSTGSPIQTQSHFKRLPFIATALALCASACSGLPQKSHKPDVASESETVPTHISVPANNQKPANSFYISESRASEFPGSVGETVIKVTSNDVSLIFTKNTQSVVQVIIDGVATGAYSELVAARSDAGNYLETPMRPNNSFEHDVQRALNLSPELHHFFVRSHLQVFKPPLDSLAPAPM